MAAFFEEQGLPGFAAFFRAQAREELEHAMRIYGYIHDRGGKVELMDVPAPRAGWQGVVDAVEEFVRIEGETTRRVWNLVDMARQEGDKATESFLQWFVNEQVEEEKLASDMLAKVKLAGISGPALLMLDRMYASRGK